MRHVQEIRREEKSMHVIGRRERSLLGRPRRRWDILKFNHKEVGREDLDWTHVAVVKTILNMGVIEF
jgi:hypothetical protein